jgi:peroxiredoxin Q/BCP
MGLFRQDLLPLGVEAPLFEAQDDSGAAVRLADLRGRFVVLVFYPADGTPTCTRQLCELRDSHEPLRAAGAAVYGVNPLSARSHAAFRTKHGFPFPLIVDEGRRIAHAYRCGRLLVTRTVYVISPEGRIVFAARGAPPVEAYLPLLSRR